MSRDRPEPSPTDANEKAFAIVAARYNQDLVDHLLAAVMETLGSCGVPQENVEVLRVPGSHEVPFTAAMLAETDEFDCVIALGVVVAGDTSHHEVLAYSTSFALQHAAIEVGVPIINGIIVAGDREQAEERCRGKVNRGEEFALAAVEMAGVKIELEQRIEDADLEEETMQFFENLGRDAGWEGFDDGVEDDDDEGGRPGDSDPFGLSGDDDEDSENWKS